MNARMNRALKNSPAGETSLKVGWQSRDQIRQVLRIFILDLIFCVVFEDLLSSLFLCGSRSPGLGTSRSQVSGVER